MKQAWIGCLLFLLLAVPPVRLALESNMLSQMFIQIPGLIAAGYLLRGLLPHYWPKSLKGFNRGGVSGIILFSFFITYWMLPRSIDAALTEPSIEWLKFISLTLFTGLPLGSSWPKLESFWKNFIIANFISMIVVMGWLYLASPVRLCNNFLAAQQKQLGWALLLLTGAAILYWIAPAFRMKDIPKG